MIQPYQADMKLTEVETMLREAGKAIDSDFLQQRISELQGEQSDPTFWQDLERAQKISQELKRIETRLHNYRSLCDKAEEGRLMLEMAQEDPDLLEELEALLPTLQQGAEEFRLTTLLKGKYDSNNAIVSLQAGAGGTEAQDWVQMLYRMYTRWCEKKGYSVKELDFVDGDEAGIKSVAFQVTGDNTYGFLKAEKGVHRLVRISPFDANARRQTSFASVDVMPEVENDGEIEIRPEDLRVDTYHSSGAGGQHINKTESAIRITHLPTGVVVSCQTERSQIQNRETAMRMLYSKLADLKEQEYRKEMAAVQGEQKKIEWGSQIRSYVFCPYTMVKDHRTDTETSDVDAVMDGQLDDFINAYLREFGE